MNDLSLQLQQSLHSAVSLPALSPRLVSAAHEFEAAMMKELLAPLQPGSDSSGSGEDDSSSALTSFAGEALGRALSDRGGLGIANSILHELTAQVTVPGTRPYRIS